LLYFHRKCIIELKLEIDQLYKSRSFDAMTIDSIGIRQQVRPIRFAFLVSLKKPETVDKAVQFSTALWGGIYNPIIPIWKRFPLKEVKERTLGILEVFDPDFIINLTSLPVPKEIRSLYEHKVIGKSDFITKKASQKCEFAIGVSVLPLLQHIWSEKIKTIKGHSKAVIASIPSNCRIGRFWSFVLGVFPKGFTVEFFEQYKRALKAKEIECSIKSIEDFDSLPIFSPIAFTSYGLTRLRGGGGFSSHLVYVGNRSNLRDLIEFWNIRAAGREVIYVPVKDYKSFEKQIQAIAEAGDYPINENVQNSTDLQKGPSVTDNDFEQISEWIRQTSGYSLPRRSWLPAWGEKRRHVVEDIIPASIMESEAKQTTLLDLDNGTLIPFELKAPSFFKSKKSYTSGRATWAAIIKFDNRFENDFILAFPKDKAFEKVIKDCHFYFMSGGVRLGKDGIVIHDTFAPDMLCFYPIKVWLAFKKYFEFFDLKIEVSPPGRIAEGIIKFMGDLYYDCTVFKLKGVRSVLNELGSRSRLTSDELTKCENILNKIERNENTISDTDHLRSVLRSKLPKDTKALTASQIKRLLGKYWKKELYFKGRRGIVRRGDEMTSDSVVEYLVRKRILRTGMYFRCEVCGKKDWYQIGEFAQQYKCRYCFTEQDIPFMERREWCYKADGMFMLPNVGEGSIAVILSLWRLHDLGSGPFTRQKFITSIDITDIKSKEKFEIDFVSLFVDTYDESEYDLVLGEARNFVDFKTKDFRKMSKLALKLSNKPYLCFSTLKDKFSTNEKKEMKKLLDKGFSLIAITRQELDPFELGDRFGKAPHKRPISIKEFSENTVELNIKNNPNKKAIH